MVAGRNTDGGVPNPWEHRNLDKEATVPVRYEHDTETLEVEHGEGEQNLSEILCGPPQVQPAVYEAASLPAALLSKEGFLEAPGKETRQLHTKPLANMGAASPTGTGIEKPTVCSAALKKCGFLGFRFVLGSGHGIVVDNQMDIIFF